ncbi:acetate/propionate family kinase [Thioflexithrix psekupsensis]|uniref:Acetate kinase n=1 Tax=Thioflexithrix psekupsensis TaxID=1570016 RepID=A0A251X4E2_9GAMM|nr:acetate/propionate family kinase [Thioflexithrix psekupsensis]OUD11740.1 acetate kinase [Thioflexithrix psekupsensis]
MSDAILVINAGSSSVKFSLFSSELDLVYRGAITGIGTEAQFSVKNAQGETLTVNPLGDADHQRSFSVLLDWLAQQEDDLDVVAVGHRVVHGGVTFKAPVLVDDAVFAQLSALIPLAPLHQPHNLSPIRVLRQLKGDLPQVACFDTAFHSEQPDVAAAFALPRHWSAQGIRRYGFHGLSYEYIAQRLPQVLGDMPARVVVAHLGNGSSMAALLNGKGVASTMGFTALDGLPMGTRSGTIDVGVVLHWLDQGLSTKEIHHILYHESGLLGVSGISSDMSVLLHSEAVEAKQAIDLFAYRISRELGSLAAALGGLDALVFTAGIGEHAAEVRAQVCQQAAWLGIELDETANQRHASCITQNHSPTSAWVIPTNEELMIAQHTLGVLKH